MLTGFFSPTADSITFQLRPVSGQPQQHVQLYCSIGGHAGKYLVVKGDNSIIAGSMSDGDTTFLRQSIDSTTITLSHPAAVPAYYVSFDDVSRKAQLEADLSDRSKLVLVDPNFREDAAQESEGLANELDLTEGAPGKKEAESKVA